MLPLRDTTPSRSYPVVNTILIALNIIFYLVELTQGADLDIFIYMYGLVPARFSDPHISSYFSFWDQIVTFISFMFLHGGFWHLLGNMWFLYIFGDNVEDSLGSFRYVIFYLLSGLTSGLFHLAFNFHSNAPTIGASGAVAGVMGAYFILHPKSKILAMIPIFIFPYFFEVYAFFFLGFWFLMQFFNAALTHGQSTGIAWWAHIGGFIFGVIWLKMFHTVPSTGISDRFRELTQKKKSHKLQIIRPSDMGDEVNLFGNIQISSFEAVSGTTKLVNVPWGFYDRLIKVNVPPGIQAGQTLRLKGLGKISPDGYRGDMMLRVNIQ